MKKILYSLFALIAKFAVATDGLATSSEVADFAYLDNVYWTTELSGGRYYFNIRFFENNDLAFHELANKSNCAVYEGDLSIFPERVLRSPYDFNLSMVACAGALPDLRINKDRDGESGLAEFLKFARESTMLYVQKDRIAFYNSKIKAMGITGVRSSANASASLSKTSWQVAGSKLILSIGDIEFGIRDSAKTPFTLSIADCTTGEGALISPYGREVFVQAPDKRSYETCDQEHKNSIETFIRNKLNFADRFYVTNNGWILQNADGDLVKFDKVGPIFKYLQDTFWVLQPGDRDLYLSIHLFDDLVDDASDMVAGALMCESYRGSVTMGDLSQRPSAFNNTMMICISSLSGSKKANDKLSFSELAGNTANIRSVKKGLQLVDAQGRVVLEASPADFVRAHSLNTLSKFKGQTWQSVHANKDAVYELRFADYTSIYPGDAVNVPFDFSKGDCEVHAEGSLHSKDGKNVTFELDRGTFYRSCGGEEAVVDDVVEKLIRVGRFEAVKGHRLLLKDDRGKTLLEFVKGG